MQARGEVTGGATATTAPPRKKRNFFRRHLALTTLGVLLLLIAGTFGGFIWYLNHELGNIPRVSIPGIHDPVDPGTGKSSSSDKGKPLNILVLGADNGNASNTVADELADGTWSPGSHRSDTIMLVHIPANRKSAQVISIPRDSWVPVPGFPGDIGGEAKINAAFSWGGPALAVRTITDFTGLPINHVAMIDWNGFKDLTNALGGVRIYIPETFTDTSQNVTWHQGWQTLNGDQALQYVRTRHGLANGDFGRIQRQQNFIRTVLASVISSDTTHNPIQLAHVVGSLGSFLTLDSGWSNSDLRSLAIGSRNLSSSDIQFATAPFGSYDTVGGQSIVRLDPTKCKNLFAQFTHGDISPYLKANPGSSLPGNQAVK
jgi:LCP family protein required for cell wall assembly